MVMKIEADECRAALTLIRRTIEEHCTPGVLPSEEMINGLYGPGLSIGGIHRLPVSIYVAGHGHGFR
ncbi:hypothetical protein EJ079_22365 [Mesorhizobium sp. M7A.F.Ce.TU.012.03.2.1]|nr:hypothetical protein EJ079_22365 [Mesorhizobium sp. M7A.F.Ce.TU.012.03.2.1]